jgi:hypothetical protein
MTLLSRFLRRARRSILRLEALEERSTPAASGWVGSVNGGALTFTGNTANEVLTLGVNAQGLITQNRFGSDGGYASNTDLDPNTPGVQSLSLANLTSLNVGGSAANLYLDLTGLTYNGLATIGVTNLYVKASADFTLSDSSILLSTGGNYTLNHVTHIVLIAGSGDHSFTVSNRTGSTVLEGGAGNNLYNIGYKGSGFSLMQIDDNQSAGTNVLDLTTPTSAQTVTMSAGSAILGNEEIDFDASLKQVNLITQGSDLVQVQGLNAATALWVNSLAGNDVVAVGTAAHTLTGVNGTLVFQGGAGVQTLVVNDSAATAGTIFGVSGSIVSAPGLTVYYNSSKLGHFGQVYLITGSGNDTIFDYGAPAGGVTTLLSSGGNDTVALEVGAAPDAFKGVTAVNAGAGTDTLVLDERSLTSGDQIAVAPGILYSAVRPFTVYYGASGGGGFSQVDVLLGAGDDNVYLYGSTAGTTTAIGGGSGNDNFFVSAPDGTLSGFAGGLYLDAGSGADSVIISEAASTAGDTLVVGAGGLYSLVHPFSIALVATQGGSFANGVTLLTGSGDDSVYLQASPAAAAWTGVNTGAGNDAVIVGDPSRGLSGLTGSIYVDEGAGSNTLVVSAAADAGDKTYGVTADVIYNFDRSFALSYTATGGTFARGIYFESGMGNDSVEVTGKRTDSPLVLQTGPGTNTVYAFVDNAGTLNGLAIAGGTGTNTLLLHDESGGMAYQIFSGDPSLVEAEYPSGEATFIYYQNFKSIATV